MTKSKLLRDLDKAEREWKAKVQALIDTGMTLDEAWVAAGGMIIPDLAEAWAWLHEPDDAASLIGVTPETLERESGRAA